MERVATTVLLLALLAPAAGALAPAPVANALDVSGVETTPVDVTAVLAGLPADAPAAVAGEAIAEAMATGALALPGVPAPVPAPRVAPIPRVERLEFGPLGEDLPAPRVSPVPVPRVFPIAPVPLPFALPLAAPAVAPFAPSEVAVAAAGSAALSLLPAFLGRFYTRLAPGDALSHPVRRRLYDLVSAEPGLHMAALAERLGIANGQLVYHLDVLRRDRLVTRVDASGAARFFATGGLSPDAMRRRAATLSGSSERITAVVRERPGVAVKDVANAVGLSVPAVHRALEKLEVAGLVERRRAGRGHAVYPASALAPIA